MLSRSNFKAATFSSFECLKRCLTSLCRRSCAGTWCTLLCCLKSHYLAYSRLFHCHVERSLSSRNINTHYNTPWANASLGCSQDECGKHKFLHPVWCVGYAAAPVSFTVISSFREVIFTGIVYPMLGFGMVLD